MERKSKSEKLIFNFYLILMIPGFKIGLRDWKEKLSEAKSRLGGTYPPFVEVYFRVDKIKEYETMFNYLHTHQIKFGLHFWGVLKSGPPAGEAGIEPNLLSRHKWIQNQSYFLMREAIQTALKEKAVFVVFHPGALCERMIDLDKSEFKMAKLKETNLEEGRENLLKNAKKLQVFAGVSEVEPLQLIFETLPTNSPIRWLAPRGPDNLLIAKQCPIKFYKDLAREGFNIANDFGHTASSKTFSVGAGLSTRPISSQSEDLGRITDPPLQQNIRQNVKNHLFSWTQSLAPATRLIHCNLILPPFNGVDTHSGLLPEDFAKNPLPDKKELIELLKIFKERDDVWIINEPDEKHVENYMELIMILQLL